MRISLIMVMTSMTLTSLSKLTSPAVAVGISLHDTLGPVVRGFSMSWTPFPEPLTRLSRMLSTSLGFGLTADGRGSGSGNGTGNGIGIGWFDETGNGKDAGAGAGAGAGAALGAGAGAGAG